MGLYLLVFLVFFELFVIFYFIIFFIVVSFIVNLGNFGWVILVVLLSISLSFMLNLVDCCIKCAILSSFEFNRRREVRF